MLKSIQKSAFIGSWSPARTDDPAVNSRMLCQLSYSGILNFCNSSLNFCGCNVWHTPCQLSYRGIYLSLFLLFFISYLRFSLFCFLVFLLFFAFSLFSLNTKNDNFHYHFFFGSFGSGSFLLSQAVSRQVPSTLKSLTSVFGMGTGGSSLLSPPDPLSFLFWAYSSRCTLKTKQRSLSDTSLTHFPYLPLVKPSTY